jgi:hypothetical protein
MLPVRECSLGSSVQVEAFVCKGNNNSRHLRESPEHPPGANLSKSHEYPSLQFPRIRLAYRDRSNPPGDQADKDECGYLPGQVLHIQCLCGFSRSPLPHEPCPSDCPNFSSNPFRRSTSDCNELALCRSASIASARVGIGCCVRVSIKRSIVSSPRRPNPSSLSSTVRRSRR